MWWGIFCLFVAFSWFLLVCGVFVVVSDGGFLLLVVVWFGLVWFCKILEKSRTRQLSRYLANCKIRSVSPLIFVIDCIKKMF